MCVEQVEEGHGCFGVWRVESSLQRPSYGEEFSGEARVTFDEIRHGYVFWLVEHFLTEGVSIGPDIVRVKQQAPFLPEAFEDSGSRIGPQNIDSRNVKAGLTTEVDNRCWCLEGVSVESVNEAAVETDACVTDVFDVLNQFSCAVLVLLMCFAACRFDAFNTDKQCDAA